MKRSDRYALAARGFAEPAAETMTGGHESTPREPPHHGFRAGTRMFIGLPSAIIRDVRRGIDLPQ